MSDSNNAAAHAIIQAFRRIAEEYRHYETEVARHDAAIARLREGMEILGQQAQDCHAAARVLKFDLIAAAVAGDGEPKPTESPKIMNASPQAALPNAAGKSIREAILNYARAAYPKPVHATALRVELEKARGVLHEKTIGMSLYRLSKEGLVRREGRKDWFYVPPEGEASNPGGDTPGLFNRDDQEEGNA